MIAAERLRRVHPDAWAVISNGYSNDPIMANFPRFGFEDEIAKSFAVEELRGVFHRVLHNAPEEKAWREWTHTSAINIKFS